MTDVRHLGIVGPTASGKSDLALRVALDLGDVEIVTIDSMQVYREMDIGTAKPTPADQALVPHHLIDLVDPDDDYSIARFQADATAVIAAIEGRGHRALLVGGTGLYLQAAIDGLDIPGQFPDVRVALDADPDTEGLHRRLSAADPLAASRMEPTNRRRVVRALEVTIGAGRPFSSFGPGLQRYPDVPFDLVALAVEPTVLAADIERRYQRQLADGFLAEVERLVARRPPWSRTASQALGYKEFAAVVAGEATMADALDLAVRRTRQFARRQRSWFRRDPRLRWVEPTHQGKWDHVHAELLSAWRSPVTTSTSPPCT